jgi:hypothetical protein
MHGLAGVSSPSRRSVPRGCHTTRGAAATRESLSGSPRTPGSPVERVRPAPPQSASTQGPGSLRPCGASTRSEMDPSLAALPFGDQVGPAQRHSEHVEASQGQGRTYHGKLPRCEEPTLMQPTSEAVPTAGGEGRGDYSRLLPEPRPGLIPERPVQVRSGWFPEGPSHPYPTPKALRPALRRCGSRNVSEGTSSGLAAS